MAAGCSEPPAEPASDAPAIALPAGFAQARLPDAPEHFTLESVDGGAPATNFNGGTPYRLSISRRRASYHGCNQAPYMIADWGESFAAMAGPQTLAGCAGSADDAVQLVLEGEPRVGRDGEGRLVLASDAHTLVWKPAPAPYPLRDPEDQDRIALSGVSFAKVALKEGNAPPPSVSSAAVFGRDGVLRVAYGCPDVVRVRYRIEGRRLVLSQPQVAPCDAADPARLERIAAVLSAPEAALGWSDWGTWLDPRVPDSVMIANGEGTLVLSGSQ